MVGSKTFNSHLKRKGRFDSVIRDPVEIKAAHLTRRSLVFRTESVPIITIASIASSTFAIFICAHGTPSDEEERSDGSSNYYGEKHPQRNDPKFSVPDA